MPQRISLYYNDYFKSWQVRYEFASGKSHSKFIESSPTEQYRQMAIETVNNRYHIKALDFVRGTCATGLPIWYAKKICVK